MTNLKATKRALLSSIIALIICFTMLLGTTYAWFTDEVTSTNNIIKAGTLDVAMEWAEGSEDPASANWADASTGAIFDYDLWEPGYTVARHIRFTNKGTLALNYQFRIVTNGELSKLAEVIDVYYLEAAAQATRDTVDTATHLGTLAEVFGTSKNISNTVRGGLEAGESRDFTLVLKMQEEAGNEYQGLSISDFSVQVVATQQSFENDSFGPDYDDVNKVPSSEIPAALAMPIYPNEVIKNNDGVVVVDEDLLIKANGRLGWGAQIPSLNLDTAFQFVPTEDEADAEMSEYRYWHADYVLVADKDVPAGSIAVAGYYDAWCQYNDDQWVALVSDTDIAANTEIRLVEGLGATVNYEEICSYGNDGLGFMCGAADLTGENIGTTLTVELRLYETTKDWNAGSGTANEETGEYIVISRFTYTFPERPLLVRDADELAAAVAAGHTNLMLADGEYDVYGCAGKTLTLNGSENAVIKVYNDGEDGCDYAFGSGGAGVGNITFNGVTVDTTGNTGNYKGFAYMKGTFNDCNFVGAYSLNNANDFEFNNCTFDFKNGYFWTWGANSVTFNGCTFNGNSKTILAHGSASTVININDCTFAATEAGYTGAGDHTAAVEIDPVGANVYTVNFSGNNTISNNYAGWTRVKDGSTGHVINGLN